MFGMVWLVGFEAMIFVVTKGALSENLVDPLILLGFLETGTQAARSVEPG